jgi:pyridine nucleotide-disulfide oxidoreductase family protein
MPSPHLVLLGGGHATLPSLARAHEWTAAGIDVTLVDPQRHLYYSGMVPEYLGGVYAEDEMRIDLARMARAAGATYVQARAEAIDPTARTVATEAEGDLPYDVLSIDVGSANPAVPAPAIATKPIARIRALATQVQGTIDTPGAGLRLIVVGGGAAGTEVALNVTGRFVGAGRRGDLDLTVIEQADRLLPGFPAGMRADATARLRGRGARVQTGTTVTAVEPRGDGTRTVRTDTAPDATADAVLWATGTVGPPLLHTSPLPTNDQGFLRTHRSLQVQAHPRIFAAGDCAAIDDLDLAKVGVHAVKQGPLLRTNLDRTLRALTDTNAVPQPRDLGTFRPYPLTPLILSTGTSDGLWTAGPLWAAHPWLLRLKHWVDRRWIRPYAPEQWGDASWRDVLGAESATSPGRVG